MRLQEAVRKVGRKTGRTLLCVLFGLGVLLAIATSLTGIFLAIIWFFSSADRVIGLLLAGFLIGVLWMGYVIGDTFL